jgi:outer membrane receptor for ferrienterochelin and colicin
MKQEKTAMLSRFVRQRRVCMVLFVASSVYGIGDVLRAADSPEASGPDIGTTTEQSSATSNGKKQGETQQLTNVVVTGVTRLDQASGYEQEQEATNQLNVLSQQASEQTPYKTVGEAVQLLPGVGVQHDTGEPRFAQIRGTDANLNDILFNGVVLPSYFPGFRAVSIDSSG